MSENVTGRVTAIDPGQSGKPGELDVVIGRVVGPCPWCSQQALLSEHPAFCHPCYYSGKMSVKDAAFARCSVSVHREHQRADLPKPMMPDDPRESSWRRSFSSGSVAVSRARLDFSTISCSFRVCAVAGRFILRVSTTLPSA